MEQPQEQNNLPQGSSSAQEFLNTAAQPTQPAAGPAAGADNVGTPTHESGVPKPPRQQQAMPPQPQYTPPPQGANPVFTDLGAEPGADEEPEDIPAKPKRSKDWKDGVIKGFINAEDTLTAELAAAISCDESKDAFRATDEEKEDLFILSEPFHEWILEKIPAGIPLLLVYGSIKTKQFNRARKAYKANKANEQHRNTEETTDALKKSGARTNFQLYGDGSYRNSPSGKYVARADAHTLDKPLFSDIDKIMAANDLPLVMKAFNMTKEELRAKGVNV